MQTEAQSKEKAEIESGLGAAFWEEARAAEYDGLAAEDLASGTSGEDADAMAVTHGENAKVHAERVVALIARRFGIEELPMLW